MHLTARFYAGLYNQNESPLSRLHLAFVRESKAGLRMASVGLDSVERVINPKTPGDVFRLKVLSDNGVVPISRLAEIVEQLKKDERLYPCYETPEELGLKY